MLTGPKPWRVRSKGFSDVLLKASVAAVVLIALTGTWISYRHRNHSQSIIAANFVPWADPIPAPALADDEPPLEIVKHDKNDIPINQLAKAELPRPVEATSSGLEAPAVPKQLPHNRFGFDREHGAPTPPETNEAKTVY